MSSFYDQFEDTTPRRNPINFQYTEDFKSPALEGGGKLYWKRGRMNDLVFHNYDDSYYAVPVVWSRPEGFGSDGVTCWSTTSEILALNHYKKYGNAQNKLKKKFDKIISRQEELLKLSTALDCKVALPESIKKDFIPRPHQKVAMLYSDISRKDYIAIFDGMRSGKTFQSLLLSAKKEAKTVLIVCPAMLKNVWENAINTLFENPKINLLNSYDKIKEDFYNICSYDIIHTINANVDFCILDEIHYMIEKNSRRTEGVMRIKANFKCGMSGTPILNSPYEILPVLEWLDKDLCNDIKLLLDSLDSNYDKAKVLSEELRSRCAIRRETSALSDGGKTFTNVIEVDCDLPKEATLQQVGQSKIPYAVEYINNYKDEKIIATVVHLETARKLASSLGTQAVVITGETPDAVRGQIQKAFADGARVLVGSQAISEGLDFSFSSRCIMVETSYSFRSEQLRRRCERVGKTEPISIDILVARHPKDRRVLQVLSNKYEMNSGFSS